jgi:hypothetical protein
MEERAIELLEKLANKLGVTIDQIWTILIYQAKIELGSKILVLSFFLILLLISGWFLLKFVIKKPCEKDTFGDPTTDELLKRVPIIVVFSVLTLIFLLNFYDLVTIFPIIIFNPEYWALHEILTLM